MLEMNQEILIKKFLLSGSSSRIIEKIYLADLIKNAVKLNQKTNKSDILRLYFPLFKLIVQDIELLSQEEFENIPDRLNSKDSYKNYQIYQVKRLNKLLFSKP